MPASPVETVVLAAAAGGGLTDLNFGLTLWTVVLFALFAFVLGKFAWGPLLEIVDEREKSIRDQVESAERAAAEAREILAKHQALLRDAGRERDELLARAVRDADAIRAELVTKAKAEAELALARAREQMRRDKDAAVAELRGQVADIAVEAASRIVKSSLTEAAQRRLVDDYVRALPRPQ